MSHNTSNYLTDIQTYKILKMEGIYFFICKVLVKLAQSTKKKPKLCPSINLFNGPHRVTIPCRSSKICQVRPAGAGKKLNLSIFHRVDILLQPCNTKMAIYKKSNHSQKFQKYENK